MYEVFLQIKSQQHKTIKTVLYFSYCFSTVPSKPQNLRVLNVTTTSIKISFNEPEQPNGVIHAYRVYYFLLNQTLLHLPMLKNDPSNGGPFNYTLINLSEFHFEVRFKFINIYINVLNTLPFEQNQIRNTELLS